MSYGTFQKKSFICPRCGVLANQDWYKLLYDPDDTLNKVLEVLEDLHQTSDLFSDVTASTNRERLLSSASKSLRQAFKVPEEKGRELWVALCQHCGSFSLWLGERMLYPQTGEAPPPHPDVPPAIRELYEEARGVLPASPRASAALLRVALEGLLEEAGYEKGSLADRLKRAHEEGKLNAKIYELAEVLRLAGNAAAHYELWKIDPSKEQEDREMILALFEFLNEVTEELIAKPKRLEEMKQKLSGRLREEGP
ncbi:MULTISPECIES: DUF4145 domain-containing protein [Thermus]|uniref:DUF4145 domain-containing protein n=1 Tax=Thermus brockianus TaxID=56956 RepID=UPI001F36F0ED|nr:DUF4145 domain-containing protein [Thermus brockianus]